MRKQVEQKILRLYDADAKNFLDRLITQDKSWIPHFDPETKAESRQWKHPDSPAPKLFQLPPPVGKIMVTIFWDVSGILPVDFFERGKTINGDYFASLLGKLRKGII